MARYAIIDGGVADYAASKGWVLAETANIGDAWDGERWNPAQQPAPVAPASVTNAQGSAALIVAGLWTPVLQYVESIADPAQRALAEVALHKTTEWRRDSPFLNSAASALGMTAEQLDALFIAASEIAL